MMEMNDQEFEAEVAALEKELADVSAKSTARIQDLERALNKDFTEADKILEELREDIEKGTDEEGKKDL